MAMKLGAFNRDGNGEDVPVLDPSSMILQVICPSLRISPDFAETKFMGRRGIFMVASACLASSSMVTETLDSKAVECVIRREDWKMFDSYGRRF